MVPPVMMIRTRDSGYLISESLADPGTCAGPMLCVVLWWLFVCLGRSITAEGGDGGKKDWNLLVGYYLT